jgi:MYXO-CTERM domain-containing protein
VIVGLPFYGEKWATASDQIAAKTTATGSAEMYTKCKSRYATDRRWDGDSQTPWTTYVENGTRYETWCDDAESIDLKLEYMVQQDVGGMGIWALGYDGSEPDMWDKIEARLTAAPPPANQPPIADAGAMQNVQAGATVTLDGSASHDPEGHALSYKWSQVGGASVALSATDVVKPTFAASAAGTYRFWLTVNDGTQDSVPAETSVVVGTPPQDPGQNGSTDDGGGNAQQTPETAPVSVDPTTPAAPAKKQGCACGASPAGGDVLFFALAATVLALRRRRR